jgi:hypothetical protein
MNNPSTPRRAVSARANGTRIPLRQEAQVIDDSDRIVDVVLTDISKDGFHLATPTPFEAGEYVRIRVPRYGDFPAEVRWSHDGEAGGVFLGPPPSLT